MRDRCRYFDALAHPVLGGSGHAWPLTNKPRLTISLPVAEATPQRPASISRHHLGQCLRPSFLRNAASTSGFGWAPLAHAHCDSKRKLPSTTFSSAPTLMAGFSSRPRPHFRSPRAWRARSVRRPNKLFVNGMPVSLAMVDVVGIVRSIECLSRWGPAHRVPSFKIWRLVCRLYKPPLRSLQHPFQRPSGKPSKDFSKLLSQAWQAIVGSSRVSLPWHSSVLHQAISHTSGRTTSQGADQARRPLPDHRATLLARADEVIE